jgi:hypothetical protein
MVTGSNLVFLHRHNLASAEDFRAFGGRNHTEAWRMAFSLTELSNPNVRSFTRYFPVRSLLTSLGFVATGLLG